MPQEHYNVLGVSRNATQDEVKKAYRMKCFNCHPDKNPSPEATAEFQRVSEAYTILSDIKKRRMYDNEVKSNHVSIDFNFLVLTNSLDEFIECLREEQKLQQPYTATLSLRSALLRAVINKKDKFIIAALDLGISPHTVLPTKDNNNLLYSLAFCRETSELSECLNNKNIRNYDDAFHGALMSGNVFLALNIVKNKPNLIFNDATRIPDFISTLYLTLAMTISMKMQERNFAEQYFAYEKIYKEMISFMLSKIKNVSVNDLSFLKLINLDNFDLSNVRLNGSFVSRKQLKNGYINASEAIYAEDKYVLHKVSVFKFDEPIVETEDLGYRWCSVV